MHMNYWLHGTISFARGWVTFGEYLTWTKASPTNQCWCQKTRVIAVSCAIKMSAVHHLVLSQYTRLTDGRTDRTDGRTDRQTELRQQYRALHYMQSRGQNGGLDQYGAERFEQQQFETAGVEGVKLKAREEHIQR